MPPAEATVQQGLGCCRRQGQELIQQGCKCTAAVQQFHFAECGEKQGVQGMASHVTLTAGEEKPRTQVVGLYIYSSIA